jgi:hypothetical protein
MELMFQVATRMRQRYPAPLSKRPGAHPSFFSGSVCGD